MSFAPPEDLLLVSTADVNSVLRYPPADVNYVLRLRTRMDKAQVDKEVTVVSTATHGVDRIDRTCY